MQYIIKRHYATKKVLYTLSYRRVQASYDHELAVKYCAIYYTYGKVCASYHITRPAVKNRYDVLLDCLSLAVVSC